MQGVKAVKEEIEDTEYSLCLGESCGVVQGVKAVKEEIEDTEYSRGRLYRPPTTLRKREEVVVKPGEDKPVEPNTYVLIGHCWLSLIGSVLVIKSNCLVQLHKSQGMRFKNAVKFGLYCLPPDHNGRLL